MKNIAILGGSHFIGVHLFNALNKKKYNITIFNRGQKISPLPYPKEIKIIKGDRNNKNDIYELFLNNKFDILFDLSGYNIKQIKPILQSFKDKIGHYIFISTPNVLDLGNQKGIFNEDCQINNPIDNYGKNKALIEDLLISENKNYGFPITILRPQGVFGPYDTWQIGFIYYKLINHLTFHVWPESNYKMNPLYVTDLINACINIISNNRTHGSIYSVAGNDIISNIDLIKMCSKLFSIKFKFKYVKNENKSCEYHKGYSWLRYNIIADCTKIKKELSIDFTPLKMSIKETINWLNMNPYHLNRYSVESWSLTKNFRNY